MKNNTVQSKLTRNGKWDLLMIYYKHLHRGFKFIQGKFWEENLRNTTSKQLVVHKEDITSSTERKLLGIEGETIIAICTRELPFIVVYLTSVRIKYIVMQQLIAHTSCSKIRITEIKLVSIFIRRRKCFVPEF